jgi:hypothetical protein
LARSANRGFDRDQEVLMSSVTTTAAPVLEPSAQAAVSQAVAFLAEALR